MLLTPKAGFSPGSVNLGNGRGEGIRAGNRFGNPTGGQREDPAIVAMRAAGLQTSGKELTQKSESLEEQDAKPSEVAKRIFEEHGLDFEYVAQETHKIMNESEPQIRLRALEFVNKILLKDEEENEEMKRLLEKANTPSVVINITSPYSTEQRSQLDILIPSL